MPPVIDADIRLLAADDLDGALLLSSTAGWNQRTADWRMLLDLAPAGSFAATVDGRIVGTAIGIDYGTFGWIAMMLVDPSCRGHGLGTRLLEAAMASLPAANPIRLDATPMGRPLYQRHGFEDEVLLTRHVADASRLSVDDAERAGHVRRQVEADLDVVTAADRAVFGADRRSLLEWALEGAAEYARIIDTDAGANYCFGRQGRLFDQIGPTVADNDEDARGLLAAALIAAEGRAVVVDMFDARRELADWLRGQGFTGQRPLFRMCRPGGGQAPEPHRSAAVEYAIFGPEFG